jgi:transcriptional regulator with XRE-family HTH domain
MEGGSPTLRRRRLGRALRALRERAGRTGEEAGDAVERSGSWISRVETGRVGLRTRDVRELLDYYGLDDPVRRQQLEELALAGKQRGWWSRYAEALPEAYAIYIGLEDESQEILTYEATVVPGLLQTEDYSRAIQRQAAIVDSPNVVDARVSVRIRRQARLSAENPLKIRTVLDEAILHRAVGGTQVLRDQLTRLIEIARSSTIDVDLRVIPFARWDKVVAAVSFNIMKFPEDPDIIWLESATGLVYEDGEPEVWLYNGIFENLTAAALSTGESVALIEKVRRNLDN